MKWAYSIQQKTKAALLLAIICLIVLAKNVLDNQHVNELGSSFSSVYEDRLVVESYIYELSNHLYQKRIMLDNCADMGGDGLAGKIHSHNDAIHLLLTDYEKTRLTESESHYFTDLKSNVAELNALELQYIKLSGQAVAVAETRSQLDKEYEAAAVNLHQLSKIQLSEGKLLNDQSKKIVAGSSIMTHFELVILIFIAIVIQILVIASRPIMPKTRQHPSLN